jgi:ELWxxDGT repeat protein
MRKIMEKVLKEMRRIAKGQPQCRQLPVLSVLALTLVIGQAAVAQAVVGPTQPVMVKDINSLQSGTTANAQQFTQVGAITFFTANDGVHGQELWKTDGTATGTVMVKDIVPGAGGSNPGYLTDVGGVLYFATDSALWKSDGTEAGTVLVKDNIYPDSLVNGGGVLYFSAYDPVNGQELWTSDGTEAGTVLVKDINPTGSSRPFALNFMNGSLYFFADDGTGVSLWKSDGTAAGTQIVAPGISTEYAVNGPSAVVVNNLLFFLHDDGINGVELWKSDGTGAGTAMVKDIYPGTTGSNPDMLTKVGNVLYFRADEGVNGNELWKSDGTEAGTVLVKDINSGSTSSDPSYLTAVGSELYFAADNGTNGRELWKSDGTEAGTVLVKDIYPGGTATYFYSNTAAIGGVFYFVTLVADTGLELWRSDGTDAGTKIVKDIWPGTGNATPTNLTTIDGVLYFTANDGVHGQQLWKSDGTDAGTTMVKEIFSGTGSSINSLGNGKVFINDVLYFAADDGTNGNELWRSDGTEAGTRLVKDVKPGATSSYPLCLTKVGDVFYFSAGYRYNPTELWKSDGTADGTVLVKGGLSSIGYLTNVGGVLYISVANDIWTSDGTDAGTALCSTCSYPATLPLDLNGVYYFTVAGASGGGKIAKSVSMTLPPMPEPDVSVAPGLWKSDGTEAGKVLVKGFTTAGSLTSYNGALYFSADDGTTGPELWKSDGTAEGTVLVKDLVPGATGSYPSSMINVGGVLYFTTGPDETNPRALWKSDGTAEGTVLVKDGIRLETFRSGLTNANGVLYFFTDDGTNGSGLWISDGTTVGTVMVKYISADHDVLINNNGKLYFSASDGLHGKELWALIRANSTTTVASGATPAAYGQSVLTATVTSGATGTVTFTEGATTYCLAVSVDGSGKAVCRPSTLSVGEHTITATYSGDGNYIGSSATVGQTVDVNQGDGIISSDNGKTVPDINDALAILRYLAGLTTLNASELAHADVAPLGPDGKPLGNGVVDFADVIMVLRRVIGAVNW